MDLYKRYQTDETKEVEGVWVPISVTAKIKVARMSNPRYRQCIKLLTAPFRVAGINEQIPPDVYQQMVRKAVAETILVDWDGLTADGQPVPYSKDMALKYITDLKDFYDFVLTAADSMETFRMNGEAVLAKN